MSKLKFEEMMELLIARHSTKVSGTFEWIDWDAIYSDLVDEGYDSAEASILLDQYMEAEGYV